MDENELILNVLKKMADAITNTFGRNCEVAVHDLRKLNESLIYLSGDVTKRQLGEPMPEEVAKAFSQEGREIRDRFNYKKMMSDGRVVKSTTTFVPNSKGEMIATFCINFELTDHLNAIRTIESLARTSEYNRNRPSENSGTSIWESIDALFEQAVSDIGKQPTTMTSEERLSLIDSLERKGAFQIKGAVDQVALMMGLSKFTVYNYLQKIRAGHMVNKF